MKTIVMTCVMFLSAFSWAASSHTFSNINQLTNLDNGTTGWGSCSSCAGGENVTTDFAMYFDQASPSLDGTSLEVFVAAPASLPYSNVLWYYKVGPNDTYNTFQFNFAYTVNQEAMNAQALEFDTFQFIGGQNYTFGTQCNFATNQWNIFNHATPKWIPLSISCKPVAGNWYRVTWNFTRTTSGMLTYQSFEVQQYNSTGKRLLSQQFYTVNLTEGSGPAPAGYADNLGVQFQIDLGPNGGMVPMWVDEVNLTASTTK
jgi:hypothetical protein